MGFLRNLVCGDPPPPPVLVDLKTLTLDQRLDRLTASLNELVTGGNLPSETFRWCREMAELQLDIAAEALRRMEAKERGK